MPRYVLEVMYDGIRFHGSQIQGDLETVQLALNKMLTILFRQPMETLGASRTDEGVHALSNFYHFDAAPLQFDLLYKGNAVLPEGVAIKQVYEEADPEFNASFAATSRRYRYRIYKHKNPFLHHRALHFPFRIDRAMLDETAAIIKGHTLFESFSKRNSQSKTFTCHITDCRWENAGEELHFHVSANRFLRGMVRGLVATQLHLARTGKTVDDLRRIIDAQNCTKAFFNVPGHGLYLEEISYPKGLLQPLHRNAP